MQKGKDICLQLFNLIRLNDFGLRKVGVTALIRIGFLMKLLAIIFDVNYNSSDNTTDGIDKWKSIIGDVVWYRNRDNLFRTITLQTQVLLLHGQCAKDMNDQHTTQSYLLY